MNSGFNFSLEYWSKYLRNSDLPPVVRWVIVIIFLVSLTYIFPKVFLYKVSDCEDFKQFWIAGKIWLLFKDAYGPAYLDFAREHFSQCGKLAPWLYPPAWYLPSVLSATINLATATYIWKIVSLALVILSCLFISLSLDKYFAKNLIFAFFMIASFAMLLQWTNHTIYSGQTPILPFFGASLLTYGYNKKRPTYSVLGFLILSFKPQIGVIYYLVLFFFSPLRKQVILGGIVVALLSIPALLMQFEYGPTTVLVHFVKNASTFADYEVNRPLLTTGIRNIWYRMVGYDIGSFAGLALGSLAAVAFGVAANRIASEKDEIFFKSIIGATAICLVFNSLHIYDHVIALIFPIWILLGLPYGWSALFALLIIFRAGNVAHWFVAHVSETYFYGMRMVLLTSASILLLIGIVAGLSKKWPNTNLEIKKINK